MPMPYVLEQRRLEKIQRSHLPVIMPTPPKTVTKEIMVALPAEFPAAVGSEDPFPDPPSPPPTDAPKEPSMSEEEILRAYDPFDYDGC